MTLIQIQRVEVPLHRRPLGHVVHQRRAVWDAKRGKENRRKVPDDHQADQNSQRRSQFSVTFRAWLGSRADFLRRGLHRRRRNFDRCCCHGYLALLFGSIGAHLKRRLGNRKARGIRGDMPPCLSLPACIPVYLRHSTPFNGPTTAQILASEAAFGPDQMKNPRADASPVRGRSLFDCR